MTIRGPGSHFNPGAQTSFIHACRPQGERVDQAPSMYRGTRARVYHGYALCVKPTGHSPTQYLTERFRALGRRVDSYAAQGSQHTLPGPVEAGPHTRQTSVRSDSRVSGVGSLGASMAACPYAYVV